MAGETTTMVFILVRMTGTIPVVGDQVGVTVTMVVGLLITQPIGADIMVMVCILTMQDILGAMRIGLLSTLFIT